MKIHTPPLRGPTDWRLGRSAAWSVAVALLVIGWWSRVSERLGWRSLLALAGVTAVGWALALALVDGVLGITDPLRSPQYLQTVPQIHDLGTFLSTFTDRIAGYNVHTQGHPPGMVVFLWVLDRLGFGGLHWYAALVYAGGGVSVVATLVAARDVAGEAVARRAAPFLVLAPAAIWWSSGDPFFAGVGATAAALLVLATNHDGRRADVLAVLGGLAFVATAYLSYGLVLLALIPIAVAVVRRRARPIVLAAGVGVVMLLVITAVSGFAWWDGAAATRERYYAGVGGIRPYDFFLVADLAAFAIMIGPAAVAGLAHRPRTRAFGAVVLGAVGAVLLADLSGLSKAEVERIWIPFVPWVVLAATAVATTRRSTRGWLAAQALVTILVAVGVRSPW